MAEPVQNPKFKKANSDKNLRRVQYSWNGYTDHLGMVAIAQPTTHLRHSSMRDLSKFGRNSDQKTNEPNYPG